MFELNTNNKHNQCIRLENIINTESRLTVKKVENTLELANKYAEICINNMEKDKWVMFINPEESAISQLASFDGITHKNVLCVNIAADKLSNTQVLSLFKTTLSANNCSAVVLPDSLCAKFDEKELSVEFIHSEANGYILSNSNITH
ncbi:hypothetical protein [Colwellia sp. RSH04]|uniref:hypothetical protein n=1 Tax=Colwellia sp. RSH04 TaxID=2305464 RepID=UPI000E5927DC|nr:hypothetical protein [Colwellia sp. RSH04]RHW77335.1 hypothetical protein D1094_05530 [Colwellia sp. RSH04]